MPAPHRVPYGCLHISHGNAFWCVNRSGSRHRRSNIGQRIGFPCGNYEPALFVEAPYQTVAGMNIKHLPHYFGHRKLLVAAQSALRKKFHINISFP